MSILSPPLFVGTHSPWTNYFLVARLKEGSIFGALPHLGTSPLPVQ